MAIVTITYTTQDVGGETENITDTYHVHNDLTKHCMRKIWQNLKIK